MKQRPGLWLNQFPSQFEVVRSGRKKALAPGDGGCVNEPYCIHLSRYSTL